MSISDVCDLAAENNSTRFAISTAAFLSARFPWVSPAATSYVTNACESSSEKNRVSEIRLVDGGYIDNSGIETALNVLDQIKSVAKQNKLENSFSVYLISLSAGDFPNSRIYSLGEIAEPISRAIKWARSARLRCNQSCTIDARCVRRKGASAI